MKTIKAIAGLLLLSSWIMMPLSQAHHSFAMFDGTKKVTLDGVIREFQYTSPHSWIQIAVTDASGQVTEWSVECASPALLNRSGWKPSMLKPGDKVQLVVYPLRSGKPSGSLVKATLSDGRVMGSGEFPLPPPQPAAAPAT